MAEYHSDYCIVQKGDTLSKIASHYGTTATKLANLNGLSNTNLIYVGQKLAVTKSGESKSDTKKKATTTNTSNKPTIIQFGLQADTDRTVFATWKWDKKNTENYKVMWYYATGNGVWFVGNDGTSNYKQSTYNAPSNATKVKFKVKAVSKKHKVNGKQTSYWTGEWSTESTYAFSSNPPAKPSAPSVEIDRTKLTASISNYQTKVDKIQFQIVRDDKDVFKSSKVDLITSSASYSVTIVAGSKYKVRCRAIKGELYSDWSDYSQDYNTIPDPAPEISLIKAASDTSVYLSWNKISSANTYDIEYADKKEYFDSSEGTQSVSGIEETYFTKIGLESGKEYFFRVRATNEVGSSKWSEISQVIVGKKPVAPTTWSSTTSAVVGEPLIFYWIHNSADGSAASVSQIEFTVGEEVWTQEVPNIYTEEDDKYKTQMYQLSTSIYPEGAEILWRVRTAGVTGTLGDWSVSRTVNLYAQPTASISILNADSEPVSEITSFPFYINCISGPSTQNPIGYIVTVKANESYISTDEYGNEETVLEGEAVYSKYFDVSFTLMLEMSAGNINLENGISYTAEVSVTMNSGLVATSDAEFTVAWEDIDYQPNAEIGIDPDTLAAQIRPYCEGYSTVFNEVVYSSGVYILTGDVLENVFGDIVPDVQTTTGEDVYSGYDEDGNSVLYSPSIEGSLVSDVLLSVYRREFDGSFTEIGRDLVNAENTFVVDPHPALDYARYRIVAKTVDTGAISYYDTPGYPINNPNVVIQWDEAWSEFDVSEGEILEEPTWAGSMLKIPYNVDISDSHKQDTSLIAYIGRSHPVSYYGTQKEHTSNWNVDIPKDDKDTLYAIRRLANYSGDVYVREPSGSGYWATINVSYSQTHNEVIIPISFSVTRVEGGV